MNRNTIKFKIVIQFLLIIIPLIIFLNVYNIYTTNTLFDQAARSAAASSTIYINTLDQTLKNISSYLVSFNFDTVVLDGLSSGEETTRAYANVALKRKLSEDIVFYDIADMIFIYTPQYNYLVSTTNSRTTIDERNSLSQFIFDHFQSKAAVTSLTWKTIKIDDISYLYQIIYSSGSYYGSFINIDTIVMPLADNQDNMTFIFSDLDNNPLNNSLWAENNHVLLSDARKDYSFTGNKHQYLIASRISNTQSFKLWAIIPQKNILEGLSYLKYIIIGLSILSALCIFSIVSSIYRWVIRPLKNVQFGINRINAGDWEHEIPYADETDEYQGLITSFNNMKNRVKRLTIDVYDETVKKQKAELRFFQMQIRPHFFLNALITVSNFIHLNEVDNAKKFLFNFTNFSRYIFRSNFQLVPINEEIQQIRHFIGMQEIRYPTKIFEIIDIADDLLPLKIPPFILLTFVENSLKHGINSEATISLFIRGMIIHEDQPLIYISMEDSGDGFSEEKLVELNSDSSEPVNGHHIGIWNVKQTLQLVYGEMARLVFSNSPMMGAMIEMYLPLSKGQ